MKVFSRIAAQRDLFLLYAAAGLMSASEEMQLLNPTSVKRDKLSPGFRLALRPYMLAVRLRAMLPGQAAGTSGSLSGQLLVCCHF